MQSILEKINKDEINKEVLEYCFENNRHKFKDNLKYLNTIYNNVILFFHSNNCKPCVLVDEYLISECNNYGKNTLLIKINREKNRDIFLGMKVRGTPTLIKYKNNEIENVVVGADLKLVQQLINECM